MTGIRAVGGYVPPYRLESGELAEAWGRSEAAGVESKSVPGADEDALTMAYEAGRRALAADAGDPVDHLPDGSGVDWLGFATTTPPVAEEDLTARLGSMLDVPEDAARQTFVGSTRAGTRALAAALDASGTALVVAADCPRGEPDSSEEHAAGAGAGALLVAPGGGGEIVDRAEHATPYPGTRFRRAGSERVEGLGITEYDREAFRETVSGAVAGVEYDPGAVDAAAIRAPDGKLPYRAAGPLGVETEVVADGLLVSELGDLGAADVPLAVATALARGDETVLAVGYGSGGGADAFVIERDGEVPAEIDREAGERVTYPEYLRLRGEITSGPPEGGGAYVSLPTWQRSIEQRHRLVAGRCPECGTLNLPPEGACRDCRELVEYEPTPLPGVGTVEAVTRIGRGGEPPEFAPQQAKSGEYAVAVVAFDGRGGPVSLPMQATGPDAGMAVGDRVGATVRRVYTQEGVTRYGCKIRPVSE